MKGGQEHRGSQGSVVFTGVWRLRAGEVRCSFFPHSRRAVGLVHRHNLGPQGLTPALLLLPLQPCLPRPCPSPCFSVPRHLLQGTAVWELAHQFIRPLTCLLPAACRPTEQSVSPGSLSDRVPSGGVDWSGKGGSLLCGSLSRDLQKCSHHHPPRRSCWTKPSSQQGQAFPGSR